MASCARARRRRSVNDAPPASSVSPAFNVPPSSRTIPAEIASPSPRPAPGGFVVKNGSNSRARADSGMPGPVSATTISAKASSAASARTVIESRRTSQPCIASSALAKRLTSTCSSLLASARTTSSPCDFASGASRMTSTSSLRNRNSTRKRALASARSTGTGASSAGALREKRRNCAVIAPMRSISPAITRKLFSASSRRPRCKKSSALSESVRSAASG